MAFKVIKPGMLALLQDLGRHGHQAIGLTTGGPMDELAFRWGNALLDNDDNTQQLEITFGMLSLEAQADTSIALTGADLAATLNDKSLTPWQTYAVKQGDILSFQQPVWGLRAYLSVKGGFQADTTLGSVATVMREKIGGLTGTGEKLQKGDVLPYLANQTHQPRSVPRAAIPNYSLREIPLILGYQYQSFSDLERAHFFSNDYTISQNSDRMGYRLEGHAIISETPGIISEGIAYGAVQIPKDGQPIVLLRDRQTIGGYPKMGCVTRFGGGLLAQKKPGEHIQFTPITVDQAEHERHLQMARLQQWR
ncbi:biotin-dependent carboxyltransferase family protein [Marinomonas posidonica]|uniref:Urea amidolyase related protein n=1 Tax=Marinomonas posidonica (strain CECT 7376 / NCIMB 14433 / IVIA-Po-181) TaxID=491952 RepID=F6CX32_MARPP|nr:biotin-dependent carboxyltransferase family protein [Marinomonas posidonica]AEF53286.1 urea amidolyase related protein [Marinomonas posidonica IVIA-Po-181]